MSDRALRLVMAALALATIGIAGYLVHVHYAGGPVVCATGGCETVQQSRYAEIFEIPVALIGLLGSVGILLSLARTDVLGRAASLALTVCGLVFAAYLIVVQLVVLDAVCEWCVANDSLLVGIALLAARRTRQSIAGA